MCKDWGPCWTGFQPRTGNAPRLPPPRFGLVRVRSPLLAESRLISTPRGTKMFQFPRFPSTTYGFSGGCTGITPCTLPHSDIPGSMPAGGSPRLIAACCVLHRLLAPRHPPYALACAASHRSGTRHTPDHLSCSIQLCTCSGARARITAGAGLEGSGRRGSSAARHRRPRWVVRTLAREE